MTGTEHFKAAERLAEQAESWADFERWPMETDERIARQSADATLALVHATLAVAAADDREADAEQRIAACVPAGGSRIQVASAR